MRDLATAIRDLYESLEADPTGVLTLVNFQGHSARALGLAIADDEGYVIALSAPEAAALLEGIGDVFVYIPDSPDRENKYGVSRPGIIVRNPMTFVERWARFLKPSEAEAALTEFTLSLMEG